MLRHPRLDPFDGVRRAGRGATRILSDLPFWVTTTSIGTLAAAGCLCSWKRSRRRIADLLGLLALGELAWYGVVLLQVTPASAFFRPDPISQNLLAEREQRPGDPPPRIRARDNFYLDLQTVRYGIEKTNVNDVFQLEHAEAALQAALRRRGDQTRPPGHPDVGRRGRVLAASSPGDL